MHNMHAIFMGYFTVWKMFIAHWILALYNNSVTHNIMTQAISEIWLSITLHGEKKELGISFILINHTIHILWVESSNNWYTKSLQPIKIAKKFRIYQKSWINSALNFACPEMCVITVLDFFLLFLAWIFWLDHVDWPMGMRHIIEAICHILPACVYIHCLIFNTRASGFIYI